MKYTIAVAQIDSVLGDISANVRKHVEQIGRAKSGGADLVAFPELSLTGYSVKDANWDLAVRVSDAKILQPIVDASDGIGVLFGGIEESPEFGIHNSAFFAENGVLKSAHRKVYLPTYGMFEEQRYFSPGKSVRAFDAAPGRIGVVVCEDLWHLPLPYILAQDGAEVIFGLAAGPTRLSEKDGIRPIIQSNLEQHKAYSRLLSVYMVYCNRVGYEDGMNFWGGSEIIGPNGELIVQAKVFEEDMIFADIDPVELRRARRFSRHFLDDDPAFVREELDRILRERRS